MNMPKEDPFYSVAKPMALPSNSISIRLGPDDTEPRQVDDWVARFTMPGDIPLLITINTFYPELFGRFYENGALVRLVQDCFREIECAIVQYETLSPNHPCPDETYGVIELREQYVVVRRGARAGALLMWKLDAGGGSAFIADSLIISVLGPLALLSELVNTIERRCAALGVKFAATIPADWQTAT